MGYGWPKTKKSKLPRKRGGIGQLKAGGGGLSFSPMGVKPMGASRMSAPSMGAPKFSTSDKKRRKKKKIGTGPIINIYYGGRKPTKRFGTRRRGGGMRKVVGFFKAHKYKSAKGPSKPRGFTSRATGGIKAAQQETKYRIGQYKAARGPHNVRVTKGSGEYNRAYAESKKGKSRHFKVTDKGATIEE